jgi:hypothetical protein
MASQRKPEDHYNRIGKDYIMPDILLNDCVWLFGTVRPQD